MICTIFYAVPPKVKYPRFAMRTRLTDPTDPRPPHSFSPGPSPVQPEDAFVWAAATSGCNQKSKPAATNTIKYRSQERASHPFVVSISNTSALRQGARNLFICFYLAI